MDEFKDENNSNNMNFRELIDVIVDYYCWKNGLNESAQEDDDGEEWKKGTQFEESVDNTEIISPHIHTVIERAFESQLNKFID